jgi:hypothetical protein
MRRNFMSVGSLLFTIGAVPAAFAHGDHSGLGSDLIAFMLHNYGAAGLVAVVFIAAALSIAVRRALAARR